MQNLSSPRSGGPRASKTSPANKETPADGTARAKRTEHASPRRRLLLDLDEIAERTGLRPAQVRYYAEMYGEIAGMTRDQNGNWRADGARLSFFKALADGKTALQALRALQGAPSVSPAPDVRCDAPAPGTAHATQPPDDPADLSARIEDLTLHMEDLSEETKQVQLLLTRVISALDNTHRPLPPGVRPWEPPDLAAAENGDAESAS